MLLAQPSGRPLEPGGDVRSRWMAIRLPSRRQNPGYAGSLPLSFRDEHSAISPFGGIGIPRHRNAMICDAGVHFCDADAHSRGAVATGLRQDSSIK